MSDYEYWKERDKGYNEGISDAVAVLHIMQGKADWTMEEFEDALLALRKPMVKDGPS